MLEDWLSLFFDWGQSLFGWLADFEIVEGVYLLPVIITSMCVGMIINMLISSGKR